MASRKIHLFRQSAVKAGTPKDYYMNPSERLMAKKSGWSVVEHEDYIETIFDMSAFNYKEGEIIYAKGYNCQAIGDSVNKDDDCGYIMNSDFINLKGIDGEMKDGLTKTYFPKIKREDTKKKNVVGSSSA